MFRDKKVAILGWGINGLDAYSFLKKQGADVVVLDRKDRKDLDLGSLGRGVVKLSLGKNYLSKGLINFDYVFRAPGVYRYLPELVEAEEKGVIITSAVKLFFDLCPAKIIGVTGTKGKGTTSTLIYNILKEEGLDVYLAGNIGYPMLSLLPKLTDKSCVVLELSSFNLIDMSKSPHIAVVLNVTSDHLDWHNDIQEYKNSKLNIVKHQSKNDYSVINLDYKSSKAFQKYTSAKVLYFSKKKKVKGAYALDNKLVMNVEKPVEIGLLSKLMLKGKHNWENVAAAVCSSYLVGAGTKSIKRAVYKFPGLEHRLEFVGEFEGVKFYNDSFATGPQPTIAAIQSFHEPTTLILGGYDKGLEYDELIDKIVSRKSVKNILLIGDLERKLSLLLKRKGYSGKVIKLGKSSMKKVVKKALKLAMQEGVVLLSPAAASFDMFESYKQRGDLFKSAFRSLIK